jgi:inosose dehydratase
VQTFSGVPSRMPCRLGVSPLSWTNDVLKELGGDTPIETCLSEAAGFGFEGVELGRKFPREPGALKRALAPHGLDLVSGWWSGRLVEQSPEQELIAVADHARLLGAMGCEVMVYGEVAAMPGSAPLDEPMSRSPTLSPAEMTAYARRVTEFAERLRDRFGLTLAYHHHLIMVVETAQEVRRFFDQTGEAVGILLDTGHAAAAGFEYRTLIESYPERIRHIHLKDVRPDVLATVKSEDLSFNEAVRRGMFGTPGQGHVDFGPIARFVARSGYRGWMLIEAEQDPKKMPPKEAIGFGLGHLVRTFANASQEA